MNNQKNPIAGKPWNELQYQIRHQILHSLVENNFKTMLPVQQASIPLLLKNYDLAVEAQTGSGKTLSFLIPLLQKYLALNQIEKHEQDEQKSQKIHIKFLLLSPTRELCQQTFSILLKLLQKLPDRGRAQKYQQYCHCVTGGNQLKVDLEKMKQGAYVVMGTVGRIKELAQHYEQNWLKKVDYLYIDEADRVLKEKGIQELIKSIQKLRRTAMFSATLQGLEQKHYQFYGMRNLAKISLKPIAEKQKQSKSDKPIKDKAYIIPQSLNNTYLIMKNREEKIGFLINFLQSQLNSSKIIIFFNTCASVDYYTKLFQGYFQKQKNSIYGIHGKLKNKRRSKIIKEFLSQDFGALFATDVVSRGIDFDHIHFIVQIDPPQDPDNYVHRIGRTARINRPGTAILLIEPHQEIFINYLQQKSVGVKKIENQSHFVGNKKTSIQTIKERIHQIMITDRDYIQKSKKAFVSYVRSYKEHDLKYIFEFKNLDIGSTAHSFFLYKIPRIKEILGKPITTFTQNDYDIESIPWKDKNQELQFSTKKQKRELQKQEQASKKAIVQNYKNIKSKRKKVRAENKFKQLKELNKEHKLILKNRKLGQNFVAKNTNSDNEMQEEEDWHNEDTQQIEKRMQQKYQRK